MRTIGYEYDIGGQMMPVSFIQSLKSRKVCPKCGVSGVVGNEFYKSHSSCKACISESNKQFRKTAEYREWLNRSREQRKALKSKYRKLAGCKQMADIKLEAREKMRLLEIKRKEREIFIAEFIGPPKASSVLSVAEYQRWLYRANPEVRKYQIEKRRNYVSSVTTAYAREQLRIANAPSELIEAKRLQLQIRNHLKEM